MKVLFLILGLKNLQIGGYCYAVSALDFMVIAKAAVKYAKGSNSLEVLKIFYSDPGNAISVSYRIFQQHNFQRKFFFEIYAFFENTFFLEKLQWQ